MITTKTILASLSLLAASLVPSIALAGAETPERVESLPPDVAACMNQCIADAAGQPLPCCEELRGRVGELERLYKELTKKKEPTKKPTTPYVSKVDQLRKDMLALINKKADQSAVDAIALKLDKAVKDLEAQEAKDAKQDKDIKNLFLLIQSFNQVAVDVDVLKTDVAVLKDKKAVESDVVDIGLKAGFLYLHSNLFNYSAVPVVAQITFETAPSLEIYLEGGAALTGSSSTNGMLARGGITYDLGSNFGLQVGASYLAGGFDTKLHARFSAVNGEVGLEYAKDWFQANAALGTGVAFHRSGGSGIDLLGTGLVGVRY